MKEELNLIKQQNDDGDQENLENFKEKNMKQIIDFQGRSKSSEICRYHSRVLRV